MSLLPKRKLSMSRSKVNWKPPPPSETTRMLEAMLEKPSVEPSKKRAKVTPFASRSVNATTANATVDVQWSNVVTASTSRSSQVNVFSRAGASLSDAPTFSNKPLMPRKAALLPSKKANQSKRENQTDSKNGSTSLATTSKDAIIQRMNKFCTSVPSPQIDSNNNEVSTSQSAKPLILSNQDKVMKLPSSTQNLGYDTHDDVHLSETLSTLSSFDQRTGSNAQHNSSNNVVVTSQTESKTAASETKAVAATTTSQLQLGLSLQLGKSNLRRKRTVLMATTHEDRTRPDSVVDSTCRLPSPISTLFHSDNKDQSYGENVGCIEPLMEDQHESVQQADPLLNNLPPPNNSFVARAFDTTKDLTKTTINQDSFASIKPLAAESSIPRVARPAANTDNFVRLNLKNHAGACRGARNKAKFNKWKKFSNKGSEDRNDNSKSRHDKGDDDGDVTPATPPIRKERTAPSGGVDPLDDYLDGVFRAKVVGDVPKCTRHQMACSLRTVKKSGGNKGRKFYSCSMPRGEQCDHFQWADDTLQAAKSALDRSSTYSGFVARQVSGHLERFRSLTVDELRGEMKKRNLQSTGKRQQLLTRLSIWLRDEIVHSNPSREDDEADPSPTTTCIVDDDDGEEGPDDSSDDDSSDASTASLELEISGQENNTRSSLKHQRCSDDDGNMSEESVADDATEVKKDTNKTKGLTAFPTFQESQTSTMRKCLKEYFGYDSFRDGQEWAILRCLNKQRSLLVAPTGFGKSLCYALPAALMDGVCIVVSPLISLIEDQLRQLPPKIPAVSLSGSLSTAAVVSTIDDIVRGRVKIVFVSPERLASASFQRLFKPKWNADSGKKERQFPPVSLLCMDEAHCATQWGVNFRPSYLRIRSLLRNIEPQSVLAITATAVPLVVDDICHSLGIQSHNKNDGDSFDEHSDDNGVLILQSNRDNLSVACVMMSNQDERLSTLLKILTPAKTSTSGKPQLPDIKTLQVNGCLSKGSIIVYVWRQMDADVVAENLLARGVSGGVVVYHGGMDSAARAKAQSRFLRGKARICVATVAFGLGVNKEDVYGVIHMQLPSSPEHYLQEIGRAGRNGQPALAIALVLQDEVVVRHSLAHSDRISKSQIRVLLEKLKEIVTKAFDDQGHTSATAHVAVPLDSFSMSCDCKIETIETLLSLMELRRSGPPLFTFESVLCNAATISLKQRTLEKLALRESIARTIMSCAVCVDPPVGERHDDLDATKASFSRQHQFLAYSFGSYSFSVVECTNQLGEAAEPRHVLAALRRLQSANEIELALDQSPWGRAIHIKVEEAGRDLFVNSAEGALEEFTTTLSSLWDSVVSPSATKVLDIADIMSQVAEATVSDVKSNDKNVKDPPIPTRCPNSESSTALFQRISRKYFDGDFAREACDSKSELPSCFEEKFEQELSYDVASIIRELTLCAKQASNGSHFVKLNDPNFVDYSALTVTKFFHALGTRRASVTEHGKHRLFGKWRQVRFCSLLDAVTKILNKSYDQSA